MRSSRLITAVEVHAEGEPGRVITGGLPHIPGDTVFARMRWMQDNLDEVRHMMLREPRGYPALCCNALVPPCDPAADMGLIIMEQSEYPPMSGSNTICATTVLLETGILPMQEPVTELTLETPAGLIRVRADCENGKVTCVTFRNVPAFAVHLDAEIDLPGHGIARVDIAWGGMFFVIADANQFGRDIHVTDRHPLTSKSSADQVDGENCQSDNNRQDDEILETVVTKVPSNSSNDHGQPFAKIFKHYDYDFYKVDPLLFSPAVVTFHNLRSGRSWTAGQLEPSILQASFSS